MTRVRCSTCELEDKSFCSMKKIGVKPNKPRKCVYYKEEALKFKTTTQPRTIKLGYAEQETIREQRKAQRRLERENLKAAPDNGTARALGLLDDNSIKHPLTGDLSRFTTSASSEE